jgi:hypothetical protein
VGQECQGFRGLGGGAAAQREPEARSYRGQGLKGARGWQVSIITVL